MKICTVRRGPSTDLGTFSKAQIEGAGREWDWLELPWRGDAPDVSCIPDGSYRGVLVSPAPHFGYSVYELQGVPGRSGICIHIANWAGDVAKGYHSDLEGCCAPGYGVGQLTLAPPLTGSQMGILNAGKAFADWMAAMGGEDLELVILPFDNSVPDDAGYPLEV